MRTAILMFFLLGTGWAQDKIDPESGLAADPDLVWVKANCTNCHSSKLIAQQRGTEETWLETIRWMQKYQGLWQIPPSIEQKIVSYLAKYYPPLDQGRRKPLPVHLRPPLPDSGPKNKP